MASQSPSPRRTKKKADDKLAHKKQKRINDKDETDAKTFASRKRPAADGGEASSPAPKKMATPKNAAASVKGKGKGGTTGRGRGRGRGRARGGGVTG